MTTSTTRRPHYAMIRTHYGDTERDCFCRATNGTAHHENDFPWVATEEAAQGEKPLTEPFRPGEDVQDYQERLLRAEAWEEGYLARLREVTPAEDLAAEAMLMSLTGVANPYRDGPAFR